MIIENNKKEQKFLKSLGFKSKNHDDDSGLWFEKTVENYILGDCIIQIQDYRGDGIITIDTIEEDGENKYVTITEHIPYDRDNLLKVLGFLI